MKPRILMLTHQCAGVGGSYMRAVSLARPMVEMGYDMTLIAGRADPGFTTRQSDWYGVHIIEMPDVLPWRIRNAGLSPIDLASRLTHVWRGRYDLFHIFDHRPSASLPVLWRLNQNVPVVSDWADLWGFEGFSDHRHEFMNVFLKWIDNSLEPYVHKKGDAVTVISSDLKKRALQLEIPNERILLTQVGSNSDIIHPMDKTEARAKYGIPLDVPVVAYCGFSSLDMELLLNSFLELTRLVPNVRLIMTGTRKPVFDEAIQRRLISQQVHHLGTVPYDQLGDVLSCGDVMLLPYQNNTVNIARFPNRFGEYLAVGRPIVTNRVGDHAVIVEQEQIGIATEPDPRSFAEGIASLLRTPDQLDEMGKRARLLSETRFTWKAIAAPVAKLYSELIG
jgi:glycosyltransferase involved in cell wall biosynthesis